MKAGSTTQIAGGEVLAAVVDERVSAVAGAVADLACDADLERPRPGPCGEGVELAVEPVRLAAEEPRDLPLPVGGQVDSRVVDLFGAVEHGAVVDPDGVGVLVLDDGAVHECAHVLERLVVQIVGRDPLRDGLGELGCDLVHVGEAVGHRHRQLLTGWALGDACADLVGERELPAEVVRALGADPEVGADGGDPVVLAQSGARRPAVAELLLLVDEAELLALVGLRLDAADLVGARFVVEQQHDQAADRAAVPRTCRCRRARGWPWRRGSGAGRRR